MASSSGIRFCTDLHSAPMDLFDLAFLARYGASCTTALTGPPTAQTSQCLLDRLPGVSCFHNSVGFIAVPSVCCCPITVVHPSPVMIYMDRLPIYLH
jgi:hypothetical protein